MSQLNISVSTSCLCLIAILFLLITHVSAKNVDSMSNYQYDNNDDEVKHPSTPDNLFLLNNINSRPERSSMIYKYGLPYDRFRMMASMKRTIPIELQKALYAHGIVGRRR